MTPDKQGYLPCPVCGVLAPVERPHPEAFCERNQPKKPAPVVVDEAQLWAGS